MNFSKFQFSVRVLLLLLADTLSSQVIKPAINRLHQIVNLKSTTLHCYAVIMNSYRASMSFFWIANRNERQQHALHHMRQK